MELFYIVVVSIAIVFLIIILTLVGIAMKYQDKATIFPPNANDCPDFWTIASDGKSCAIPSSGKRNIGSIYDENNVIQIKHDTSNAAGNVKYSFPEFTPATNGTKTAAPSRINFKDDTWNTQGLTNICAKKKWATKWGITWDGVSNYNSC